MTTFLDEAQAELSLVVILRELGFDYAHGPDIAPDGPRPERADYADAGNNDRLVVSQFTVTENRDNRRRDVAA